MSGLRRAARLEVGLGQEHVSAVHNGAVTDRKPTCGLIGSACDQAAAIDVEAAAHDVGTSLVPDHVVHHAREEE
jgi:hypothetical protein